jgi:hypothetical protein
MNTVTMQRPALVAHANEPRVSIWRRLWLALEAQGQRRAAAELRRLAAYHLYSDPEMNQRLRALADKV